MLDYWEAFTFFYLIPVISYYASAFIFDICNYYRKLSFLEKRKDEVEKYDTWPRGFILASCNLLVFYHIPFKIIYYFIRDRIIKSTDWFYILNGPFVILFYMLMFDVLFYSLHRYFHVNKYLYTKIHKIHHFWTRPFAITGLACHPIEFLVVIMFPYIFPIILFPYTHVYWIYLYSMGTAINNTVTHSGLFALGARDHDMHHLYYKYNYGITIFPRFGMDYLCKTKYIEKKE